LQLMLYKITMQRLYLEWTIGIWAKVKYPVAECTHSLGSKFLDFSGHILCATNKRVPNVCIHLELVCDHSSDVLSNREGGTKSIRRPLQHEVTEPACRARKQSAAVVTDFCCARLHKLELTKSGNEWAAQNILSNQVEPFVYSMDGEYRAITIVQCLLVVADTEKGFAAEWKTHSIYFPNECVLVELQVPPSSTVVNLCVVL
jgi:hypothetical protein